MEIKLKENVYFVPYEDQKLLKQRILDFIFNSKTDKILYKGNPHDINYKLLKKIIPVNEIKKDKEPTPGNIREIYNDVVKKVNCKYCLIYKK